MKNFKFDSDQFLENSQIIFDSMYKAIDDIRTIKWEEILNNLTENISKGMKSQEQIYITLMLKAQFPPIKNLSLNDIIDILEVEQEKGIEEAVIELRRIIDCHYTEEKINTLLVKWSKVAWLDRRFTIIEEAIDSHKKGKYFSSVATLLPQIEGIFADGTDHKGDMNIRSKIKLILDNSDNKLFSFEKEIQSFYLTIVLDKFGHNEPINSILSRHAILHGGDVNYGTKENSLRCIILFDYLLNKIDSFKRRCEIT